MIFVFVFFVLLLSKVSNQRFGDNKVVVYITLESVGLEEFSSSDTCKHAIFPVLDVEQQHF